MKLFRGRIQKIIQYFRRCSIDKYGRECANCMVYKTYEFFYKDPARKYGYGSNCIECKRELTKRYSINLTQRTEACRKYYENNKEKCYESTKRWKQKKKLEI